MKVFSLDPCFPIKLAISKVIQVLLEFNRTFALVTFLHSGLSPNLCLKSREDYRFHLVFAL